jgi:thioredoxin 1
MEHTVEITTENFDSTMDKQGIVLLDWWASWCAPCRAFGPVFEAAAAKHNDVVFGKIDTEAQTPLAASFEIRSIPTLMVFKDGVLLFAQPGMLPEPALETLITKARALDMDLVRAEIAKGEPRPAAASPR